MLVLKPCFTLRGPEKSRPIAIGMSRGGGHVAVARENKSVELWSVEGELIGSHSAHERPIRKVCVSSDGRLVATLSEQSDGEERPQELIVWDAESSVAKRIQPDSPGASFRAPIFFPRSHQLAVGSNRPLVYDGLTGKLVPALFPISWEGAAFSDCGEFVAIATEHGPIHVLEKSRPYKCSWLRGHEDAVERLAFAEEEEDDGTENLGTLSRDGTLFIWYFPGRDQIGEAHIPYEGVLHFSHIHSIGTWLVVHRTLGLRCFDYDDAFNFANFPLPEPSTITAVTSDSATRLLVFGRSTGAIEIWDTFTLLPYVPHVPPDALKNSVDFITQGRPMDDTLHSLLEQWEDHLRDNPDAALMDFIAGVTEDLDRDTIDRFMVAVERLARVDRLLKDIKGSTRQSG
jgi:WD40 repeat protein